MVEYGIGAKGVQWGHTTAINSFSGGKSYTVGPKDKKKFNFKEIKTMNTQSYFLGCMDFAQMGLALATEVEKMDGTSQDKFELLIGEIEILYMEATNTFIKHFGKGRMPDATLEDIMGRRKKWSVDVLDLDENTKTSFSETSQNIIH